MFAKVSGIPVVQHAAEISVEEVVVTGCDLRACGLLRRLLRIVVTSKFPSYEMSWPSMIVILATKLTWVIRIVDLASCR